MHHFKTLTLLVEIVLTFHFAVVTNLQESMAVFPGLRKQRVTSIKCIVR